MMVVQMNKHKGHFEYKTYDMAQVYLEAGWYTVKDLENLVDKIVIAKAREKAANKTLMKIIKETKGKES